MRSRRFSIYDSATGPVVMDEKGHPWAEIPRSVDDPDARAEALLAVARKVYSLGLADAYAGNQRSFLVRKADDGEGVLTWDLMSVGKEVRRIGSVPRRRFRLFPDPLRKALEGLGAPLHSAALADGRQGAGRDGTTEAFLAG